MKLANINTFPVNHSELVVVYPRSDDPVLYQEAFRTWQLIRLPAGLGGEKNGVSALRMFSIVYASISGACPGTESVDISSDLERRCKRHSRIR